MSPGEAVTFLAVGIVGLVVIILLWFIFRKKKKVAIVLTSVLVIGYIVFLIYYPTLKVNTHAKKYEILTDYLEEAYPDKEFTIVPKHYEPGYLVGDFQVNEINTPTFGVSLRVAKGKQVIEVGRWEYNNYPR